jgi:exodeoxyribonuclease V alpha subunit
MFKEKSAFLDALHQLIESGDSLCRWVDYYAARFTLREVERRNENLGHDEKELLAVLVLLLGNASREGKTQLALSSLYSSKTIPPWFTLPGEHALIATLKAAAPVVKVVEAANKRSSEALPIEQLDLLEAVVTIPEESDRKPSSTDGGQVPPLIVMDNGQISLHRFWRAQIQIDHWRSSALSEKTVFNKLQLTNASAAFVALFPNVCFEPASPDLGQALATLQSTIQPFNLISGGPGTGKTTTAVKIILLRLIILYFAQNETSQENVSSAKVFLLAPTGKAAQRLARAILSQLPNLLTRLKLNVELETYIQRSLAIQGMTVHRFLNQAQGSNKSRPTNLGSLFTDSVTDVPDLVLIDESSMVDLELMQAVLSTLSPKKGLIMLGDYFQLPAVEPGDVFAQWVSQARFFERNNRQTQQIEQLSGWPLNNDISIIRRDEAPAFLSELKHSFRFSGALASAAVSVKAGDNDGLFSLLRQHDATHNLAWSSHDDQRLNKDLRQGLLSGYERYFDLVNKGASYETLYAELDRYRILSPSYQGSLGVEALNDLVEVHFQGETKRAASRLYHGKALLMTKNMPALGLFNGDIGIVIAQQNGEYLLCFGDFNERVEVSPLQVAGLQPAYAMTVHKSQGSEYEKLSVVISMQAQELLSRSLLYTALTRAKTSCHLYASAEAIEQTLSSN